MATENLAAMARELGRGMSEMRTFLRQQMQVKIKAEGLNISFELLEVMFHLQQKDGAYQQEIADVLIKDKSSMTYLIDNLVKRELVARMEDPNDRRNKKIFLTEQGKKLLDTLNPWVMDMYGKATDGIKAADLEKAILLVQRMNKKLKE